MENVKNSPAGAFNDNITSSIAQLLYSMKSHLLTSRAPSVIAAASFVEDEDVLEPDVLPTHWQLGIQRGIWHYDDIVCDMIFPFWQLRPTNLSIRMTSAV